MQRYVDFYNAVHDLFEVPPFEGHSLNMKQNACLKFYLREYMHLPVTVIAEMVGQESRFVARDLRKMAERASDKAVPVVMQTRYRETLEQLDDLARDMGFTPRPLGNLSPESQLECLWAVAQEIGRPGSYDGEDEVQADLRVLVDSVLDSPSPQAAVDFLRDNYLIYVA